MIHDPFSMHSFIANLMSLFVKNKSGRHLNASSLTHHDDESLTDHRMTTVLFSQDASSLDVTLIDVYVLYPVTVLDLSVQFLLSIDVLKSLDVLFLSLFSFVHPWWFLILAHAIISSTHRLLEAPQWSTPYHDDEITNHHHANFQRIRIPAPDMKDRKVTFTNHTIFHPSVQSSVVEIISEMTNFLEHLVLSQF